MNWRTPILAIALLTLVAACGDPGGAPVGGDETTTTLDPTTTMPDPIPSGDWILVSGSPIVDGYPITFTVDGDTFSGTAACNRYGGTITRTDDSIVLSEIFQTEMACVDAGVMEAESAYLTALAAATRWSIIDGQLHLETPSEPLVFDPAPEASGDALDGTTWILVSGSPIVDGYPITFSVDGEGFGGTAACNVYGGTITRSDDAITLSEIFQTLMACTDTGVMESESAFVAALGMVTSWSIVDGQLHLEGPDETLVFDPAPEVPTDALVDTTWILDTVIQGDVASTPLGDEATLVLAADGTVTGSTGCRTFSGTWVERNGQIDFPELTMEGDCSADLADQDSLVVNVLGDGFTAEIDGSTLTITSMGNEGLIYIAESS
jgi:heat shock protein HslJ